MDQVVQDYIQQGILIQQPITAAYRAFFVAKSSGAARFVMDLSPLTPFYRVPHITLYSAARVLSTLQPWDKLFKIDLTSGFYQLRIREQHRKFYRIFYKVHRLAFTRLPMGHPLAPYVLQRLSIAVANYLHRLYDIYDILLGRLALLCASTTGASNLPDHPPARFYNQLS
jgi:hypothetical protein